MAKAEDIKQRDREIYDAIAESYDARMAQYNARFAADLIDLLCPQKGEAALDLAGGTGAAGLRLAERIGPEGKVTIVDISAKCLDKASYNAALKRLANIETRVMDAEALDIPDASCDIVVSCFGIQYVPDVPKALSEVYRVLKPGGRIGLVVWSVPERFPFGCEPMSAFMDFMAPASVRALLKVPWLGRKIRRRLLLARSPLGYSPCRFSKPGSLEKLLNQAGFTSVRRDLRAFPLEFASFEEYWDTVMMFVPAGRKAELPSTVVDQVWERVRARLAHPRTGSVLLFNEAAFLLASKPLDHLQDSAS